MAAASFNSELLIAGILRKARGKDDPSAWLKECHGEALDAVMAGDEFITNTGSEAGSHAAEQRIPANTLLQLYEAALQILEAEAAAAAGSSYGSGAVRYGDFSGQPCTLG